MHTAPSHLSTNALRLEAQISDAPYMASQVYLCLKRLNLDVVWQPAILDSRVARSTFIVDATTTEVIEEIHDFSRPQPGWLREFNPDEYEAFVVVDYGLGTITKELLSILDSSKTFILAPRSKNLNEYLGYYVVASRYQAENAYDLPDHKLYVLDEESVVEENMVFSLPKAVTSFMRPPCDRPGALEAALATSVWALLNNKNIAIASLLGYANYSVSVDIRDKPYKFFGEILDESGISKMYIDYMTYIKNNL